MTRSFRWRLLAKGWCFLVTGADEAVEELTGGARGLRGFCCGERSCNGCLSYRSSDGVVGGWFAEGRDGESFGLSNEVFGSSDDGRYCRNSTGIGASCRRFGALGS